MLRSPTNPPKKLFLHLMALAVTDEPISSSVVDHDLGAGRDTCPRFCPSEPSSTPQVRFCRKMTALLIIPGLFHHHVNALTFSTELQGGTRWHKKSRHPQVTEQSCPGTQGVLELLLEFTPPVASSAFPEPAHNLSPTKVFAASLQHLQRRFPAGFSEVFSAAAC